MGADPLGGDGVRRLGAEADGASGDEVEGGFHVVDGDVDVEAARRLGGERFVARGDGDEDAGGLVGWWRGGEPATEGAMDGGPARPGRFGVEPVEGSRQETG